MSFLQLGAHAASGRLVPSSAKRGGVIAGQGLRPLEDGLRGRVIRSKGSS
jgi:hypothetical protein